MTKGPLANLVSSIAAGEVTAEEATRDHLERMAASELNAFTSVDGDRALDRARHLDARRAAGDPVGSLHGAPIAVKDIIDQAGAVTTCGSSFYRKHAEVSAPVIERLERAGAVLVGRTGLHEFAYGFSSENEWFGPVRNPWDPATSPGGSSGGSAVAVAAGLALGALGTDTGGSVRVPAAMCGLVGLKVTHGRVPLRGVFPLAASLDTVGPLTRSVGDAALLYAAMAGHDPEDPWSVPVTVKAVGSPAKLRGLRIGIPQPWASLPVEPGIALALKAVLDSLSDLGVIVESVTAPALEFPGLVRESHGPESAAVHRGWLAAHPERYGAEVRQRLESVATLSGDDYGRGLEWRARTRHAIESLWEGYDLLATPTVAAMRKVIGQPLVSVAGEDVSYRDALSRFTAVVNHAGVPALALPLAAAGDPPSSLQLIAPAFAEHRLLEVGLAMEAEGLVTFRPPPESK